MKRAEKDVTTNRAGDLQRLILQARQHGVRDQAVLTAIGQVPRNLFVPKDLVEASFEDSPLPIGEGQTISQPAMVALMAEASCLSSDDNVLEIGAGSGYGAAILRTLAARVTTVERIETLASQARTTLKKCGFDDVDVVVGDGTLGWSENAPYDAIIVTAAGPSVPSPLIRQLKTDGRLVMPVGRKHYQQYLMRFTRQSSNDKTPQVHAEELMAVRFVPLIGEHGF